MADTALLARTEPLFKEVYPVAVQSLINGKTVLASNLERVSDDIDIGPPATARVPLRTGRNPGLGARGFRETLPTAYNSKWEKATIQLAYNYASFYIPGQYLKATGKEAAFATFLTEEIEATTESAALDYNRQLYGDGTGVLAVCAAGGPSLTVTVDTTKYLFLGQIVDIRDVATGTPVANGTNRTITAMTATTITLDAAGGTVTTAATDRVYNNGSRNNEIDGIRAMVSAGDPPKGPYQGLAVATQPLWAATIDTSAVDPSEDYWQSVIDKIDIASGTGGDPLIIITTHGIRAFFAKSLLADRRIIGDTMTLKGGFKAVTWNGNAIVAERDATPKRTDFINLTYVREYQMADWGFMDQAGSRLIVDPAGSDGYIARLFKYSNLGCHHRGAHGAATNQNVA